MKRRFLFILIPALFSSPPSSSATPAALARGKILYEKNCAQCHGLDGRGDGEAAYLLYPKPRDFVRAQYLLVSTWERVPTDEDLFNSISRGLPGSSMPPWSHLSEADRRALVQYIKSFAEASIQAKSTQGRSLEEGGIVAVPKEPAWAPAALAQAKDLFLQACAGCHGVTGKGDGSQQQIDSRGYPTRPRDLTLGIFKGNPDPASVYRRIVAGMPGSPMPMSDWAPGDSAWLLTRYVLSMSSPEQRARNEMKRFKLAAKRVKALPDHPDAGGWRQAPAVNLHLMPLWWRSERPEILTVKALHDGKSLAVLALWDDETHDQTAIRVQDFRDAVALELSADPDPPFFGMGSPGRFVEIWMWKSERQADLEPAFQDIDKMYPYMGIDAYPNLMRSSLEQPTRQALTLESDPVYITGWGAGNIVSDPTRHSSAEYLKAQGFGTLKAHPKSNQNVEAKGVYDLGSYRVVLMRPLRSPGGVALSPGKTVPVAFAVWNGSKGDRDGKKSVTVWQDLHLE